MNTSTCQETTSAATASEPPPAIAATSTLIEFPGTGRARPQWRKELSERVREIQQRRALEATRDMEESTHVAASQESHVANARSTDAHESAAPSLGLVPALEPQEMNPIVVKALERVERARQQEQQRSNAMRQPARGTAAAAAVVARAQEETYRAPTETHALSIESQTATESLVENSLTETVSEKSAETVRATNLVVVPPAPIPVSETDALINDALTRPRPRRHLSEIADEALLQRREAATMPQTSEHVEDVKEVASPARRFVGGVIDLAIVAFASSPFAAIMELTSGNWRDPRVSGSLAGIVVIIMFVYLTASVAFTGRTFGMALVSVRAVDERSGLIPTAGQCARRALFYMLSLATLGLALLPALFGSERRALHDRLSGTRTAPAE
ncbi:MAG: hypothetical protein QOE33_1434 [Acidobacteriota bacterium]|nr:hypothetical protein [Acidobacteriota bacterium]